jgi:hypothetical protein
MNIIWSAQRGLSAIAILLASVPSAFGAILIPLNNNGTDAKYAVYSADPRAVNATFTGFNPVNPAKDGLQGKLFIEKNFTDNSPLEIIFEESGFVRNFGLRIQVSEKITNNTDQDWCGFMWELMELNNEAQDSAGDDGTHPAEAHFHAMNDFNHQPFGGPMNVPMGRPYAYKMTVMGGGRVKKNGGMFTPGSTTPFVIHEWSTTNMGADGLRKFKLIQTPILCPPVPEPGSFATFIVGAIVLAQFRRRTSR